jgi:hypothetical protein
MAPRHDGGYRGEHETQVPEQYGGRSRDSGRGWGWFRRRPEEEWDRPQHPESGRFGGEEQQDYPRFGESRSRRDFERDDSDLGTYAGRGYEESGWERGGGRGFTESGGWGRESFEGSQTEPRRRWSRGGYGEREADPAFERRHASDWSGERGFGGYGDAFGGHQRGSRLGETSRAGYGGFQGFERGSRRWSDDEMTWGGRGREAGRFTGRGPKGYQRSDDRIREEICDLLTADPDIDPSEVTVVVRSCEVTLEGTVDDRQAKRHVEDVAESVAGVRQVHNRLQVQTQAGRPGGELGSSRAGNGGRTTSGQRE